MNSGTGIYKSGVLAFFAGAILIGALLGAVTFCFMGSDELSMLSVLSNSFVDVRSSGDLEEILVRSFFSSTVFLAVVFLSGFSSLGQPLAVAVLLLRGMGWGVAMSQLCCEFVFAKTIQDVLDVALIPNSKNNVPLELLSKNEPERKKLTV